MNKISINELQRLRPDIKILEEIPREPGDRISYFICECPLCKKYVKVSMRQIKTNWKRCCSCYQKIKGDIKASNFKSKFLERANDLYNNKYDYSKMKYKDSKIKSIIICPDHGEFLIEPQKHLRGRGCPKCAREVAGKKRALTKDDFIRKARKVHGDKYDYSKFEYSNDFGKSIIICPDHGEFLQQASVHIRMKSGCPKCNESKGEERIRLFLEENNIIYKAQHRFDDCKYKNTLPFDFYLPDYNTCIEYDGIQHFKIIERYIKEETLIETRKRDKIKTEYCKSNGISLIRIKYTKYDKIEDILVEKLKLDNQRISG